MKDLIALEGYSKVSKRFAIFASLKCFDGKTFTQRFHQVHTKGQTVFKWNINGNLTDNYISDKELMNLYIASIPEWAKSPEELPVDETDIPIQFVHYLFDKGYWVGRYPVEGPYGEASCRNLYNDGRVLLDSLWDEFKDLYSQGKLG